MVRRLCEAAADVHTIESVFEEFVASAASCNSVAAWARVESAASARRLAAMVAILDRRYAENGSAQREQWCMDNWGAVAAEIGAEQNITTGAAAYQLSIAVGLRDRLPKVAALFFDGAVSFRLVATIVNRTVLVTDRDAQAAVDADLAKGLVDWTPMSEDRAAVTIDSIVAEHDPHAVRRTQTKARGRSVGVDLDDNGAGLATLWATLFAHDARAFDAHLDALAETVCSADPRTNDQRRSDAVGAIAVGAERLACLCADDDCPAGKSDPVGNGAVVYVVVNDDTLDDQSEAATAQDAALDGEQPPRFDRPVLEMTLAEIRATPRPAPSPATRPGMLLGGPFVPGAIARRAALNAKVRRVFHPGDSPPEPRYVPSRRLAEFVRCRDLTCRFPGCDEPATNCDLDHSIAWADGGSTCASNLRSLCRRHHLLKTFRGGPHGWRDRQLPDGTIEWTSPNGRVQITEPGSRLLFPRLCEPTRPVEAAAPRPPESSTVTLGLNMPRRRRTRAEDRARRILEERRENEEEAVLQAALVARAF
ncbi:HNH endonuclease signature motif containing protein [Mycolicibacterium sediminis]|uniref:HNH nuclease domain-containing protein n=2 Tax=Mycolicibacterium sediminis TaxID=1286180 RepID=A0A7I7QXL7_9MYCO|nr:hypothetical protein MSEDJ_52250 [Mycolicibacterium sediminis]